MPYGDGGVYVSSKDGGVYVSSKGNMPQKEHYAIMEFDSIFIPGDERSRTNPGHGYPEHSENTIRYIAYDTKENWEAAIRKREESKYGKRDYVAFHVDSIAKIELIPQITIH